MPEQDNWREKLGKYIVKDYAIDEKGALLEIYSEELESFIESLLSSQARALKEKMKAEAERLKGSLLGHSYDGNNVALTYANDCIDKYLSAIESIEI